MMQTKYAALLLFIVALIPRVAAPGAFITVDEAYHWFERAELFLQAVQQGDYAATNIIGHPGVTTMWLGAAGKLIHQAAVAAGWLNPDDRILYYHALRFPVGLVTALCVALAFPLLHRLFNSQVAWLAALLWAADPFLIAHSKILHVDALLTSFITLALLAAMAAVTPGNTESQRINWPMLTASAVAGGLAFLTKSPSVLLLPMVGLILLVSLWGQDRQAKAISSPFRRFLSSFPRIFLACAMWGAVALAVWFVLWPAAWVDPAGAAGRMMAQVRYEGGEPHGWGNFFLGRPVEDPGARFYPVVIALRLTPWTLIGLLAAGVALLVRNRRYPAYPVLVLLFLFALIFIVMLTLPPKKFDRYTLPIFPVLDILAAVGLLHLAGRWLANTGHQVFIVIIALLALVNVAWYHPYELAYYNPLTGGGKAAVRLVPVGWGEGMGKAGRYITRQIHGCDRPVASWFQPVLEPFTCTPVLHLSEAVSPDRVDYAVLYIDQVQRNNVPGITAMLQQLTPVHTIRIHGIDYAAIYQLPRPLQDTLAADFGANRQIRLHSYTLNSTALRSSGVLTLTTQWQARAPGTEAYMLFVHVLDAQGRQIAQIDAPPGGPHAPAHVWQTGHYITWYHPIPIPPELPAGQYWLSLGLYDPQHFTRLPLHATPPPRAPEDGAHALLLPFEVP